MDMGKIITIIGGVNMDISAALTAPFVPADSVPGRVTMSCGGVARNIACNLRLMGHDVKFVSVFGGGPFGEMCWRECRGVGLDLSLSERREGLTGGLYLCINDQGGEMVAGVADTGIADHITPQFLEERMQDINASAAVVADTNIPEQAVQYLIDHCTPPLLIDTVSTAKAVRATAALQQSSTRRLHAVKLNLIEARAVTGAPTAQQAAQALVGMGIGQVYITLGSNGVYCSDGKRHELIPALHAEVVNATGAGDAFAAGVVHAQLQHKPLDECARTGLKAARAALLTPQAVNPQVSRLVDA